MKKMLMAVIAVVFLMTVVASAQATIKILPVTQVWQHKDTNMWCNVCGAGIAHPVHSPGCNHCDMYCAPGAISMFALYEGKVAPNTQQDDIYDNGKSAGGEIMGNGILETHGVGMFAGLGGTPPEIQTSFAWSIALGPFQYGPQGTVNPMMTCAIAELYIDCRQIILWIDTATWPQDMSVPEELEYDSGHCKIIAGYDDNQTADFNDDQFYIYDPWPTSGSPYWAPQASVIGVTDIYLTTVQDPTTPSETTSWGKVKNLHVK